MMIAFHASGCATRIFPYNRSTYRRFYTPAGRRYRLCRRPLRRGGNRRTSFLWGGGITVLVGRWCGAGRPYDTVKIDASWCKAQASNACFACVSSMTTDAFSKFAKHSDFSPETRSRWTVTGEDRCYQHFSPQIVLMLPTLHPRDLFTAPSWPSPPS